MNDEKDYGFTGYNSKLKENSRSLRKNMTEQERHLWFCFLRNYPVKFVRQRIIDNFIADFYCSNAKLVVELDGAQHFEENALAYDKERTQILNCYGVLVIRFSNYEIDTNFNGVCMEIDRVVKERLG